MSTPAPAIWTAHHEQWLCQGDLFVVAPIVETTLTGQGAQDVSAEIVLAPALLATFDCALDKANKRGESLVREATFLPLRSLTSLEGNKQRIVRTNTITPYDYFYVGDLPDLGESYVSLNNPSTITIDYFAPELQMFDGEEEAHLVATRHDERLGTLATPQVALFKDKWNAHWTRRLPTPQGSP